MVPAKMDAIVIAAHDVASLQSFYERLGWESRGQEGLIAQFRLEGGRLVLFDAAKLSGVVGPVADRNGGFGGITPAMIVESPEALDRALETAVEAGATLVSEAADRPWGSRTGYFADPERNVWEVACLPAAPAR